MTETVTLVKKILTNKSVPALVLFVFCLVNLNSSPNQNSVSEHAVTQPQLEDSSGSLTRTRSDEVSFLSVLYSLCFHRIQCVILSMGHLLIANRYLEWILIDLQNHRTIKTGRDIWRLNPNPLLKEGSMRAGCLGLGPVRFWVSRMETPQPLWTAWSHVWPPS